MKHNTPHWRFPPDFPEIGDTVVVCTGGRIHWGFIKIKVGKNEGWGHLKKWCYAYQFKYKLESGAYQYKDLKEEQLIQF